MGKIERGLLDKMVNGAFLGKRTIGRPLKYNIRTKKAQGYVYLTVFIFTPRWLDWARGYLTFTS